MERVWLIAMLIFLVSNILAVLAVCTPSWIVHEYFGTTRFGLHVVCVRLEGEPSSAETCEMFEKSSFWLAVYVFLVGDIVMTTLAIGGLVLAQVKPEAEHYARPFGYTAVVLGSLAAVVFPFGFSVQELAGDAYKLPEHARIGYSYFVLCASVLAAVVAMGVYNSDVARAAR